MPDVSQRQQRSLDSLVSDCYFWMSGRQRTIKVELYSPGEVVLYGAPFIVFTVQITHFRPAGGVVLVIYLQMLSPRFQNDNTLMYTDPL